MTTLEAVHLALTERYEFVATLGEGGMAFVSRMRDRKLGRDVALKVLKPALTQTLAAERFLREVNVTATLQHPHILPLFDSGEVEGTPWYAMPYVAGESLRQRLEREGRLGVRDTVLIARQVSAALSYAHRHGVVHRDIKPENILLHDGNAYVADFGIALAVARADTGRLTATGTLLGTPHYLSPEQASGDADVDARCDQWALGAVMYEMLAGAPPHSGPTLQALLTRIVVETPASLTQLRPAIEPDVEAIVMRALAKVPGDRFRRPSRLRKRSLMRAGWSRARWRRALALRVPTLASLAMVARSPMLLQRRQSGMCLERQWFLVDWVLSSLPLFCIPSERLPPVTLQLRSAQHPLSSLLCHAKMTLALMVSPGQQKASVKIWSIVCRNSPTCACCRAVKLSLRPQVKHSPPHSLGSWVRAI